ncbi:Serine/threonine-protein kinase tel1 [Lambiella insularis]|nr:Serine/threonine-protein kinase tel1 [Lambiella insularis]
MGDVSIYTALENIRSSKVNERTDGLAGATAIPLHINVCFWLMEWRSEARAVPEPAELETGYHKLFETLFRISQNEKANYTKAAKVAKARSATRLTSYAGVLRLAVEVGVHTIRYKTVRALIDHVMQTLPHPDDHYCEPLLVDYVKALRTIVEQHSHVEHLSKEEWQALVDFSIDGIQYATSFDDGNSSLQGLPNVSTLVSRASTPSTLGSSLGARKSVVKFPSSESAIRMVDEFAICLSCLLSTSNAPIMDRASVVAEGLMDLLHTPSTGGANRTAFMSLNSVLARCLTEDINLAQQMLRAVLPHIRRLWQAKSSGLKEEMLKTLIYAQQLLSSFKEADDYFDYRNDLEAFFDVCIAEYGKRLERDQLQVEDLILRRLSRGTERPDSLHLHVVELQPGSAKSEAAWALLHTMTTVFSALHGSALLSSSIVTNNHLQTPQKRRKVSAPIDTLLNPLSSKVMEERVVALQLLVFVMDSIGFDKTTLLQTLEKMCPFVSGGDSAQANWSLIAMSCLWLRIWQLAARYVSSAATSRTACHLLAVILELDLIEFVDVVDIVDTMLSSVDLNGPALLTDSAVSMWAVVANLNAKHSPATADQTSERVLRWLFIRWRPSQIYDRHHVTQLSQNALASSIMDLTSAVLRLPQPNIIHAESLGLGSIAQAIMRCRFDEMQIRYLLLVPAEVTGVTAKKHELRKSMNAQVSEVKALHLLNIAIDFLTAEVSAILRQEPFSETAESRILSADIVRVTSSLCVVAFGISSTSFVSGTNKARSLGLQVGQLTKALAHLIPRQDNPVVVADGILGSLGILLNSVDPRTASTTMLYSGTVQTAVEFNPKFWQQVHKPKNEDSGEEDLMEIGGSFESQKSNRAQIETYGLSIKHEWLCATTDAACFRASLTAEVCLASLTEKSGLSDDAESVVLRTKHIEYLTTLSGDEFLACRPHIKRFLEGNIDIDVSAALILLEYLGTTLLQPYEFERSEVAQGVCLDIMTSLASMWLDDQNSSIAELGSSLYEWFIKVLSRGIFSPHVHCCLSRLLQRIIKVRPDYTASLRLVSARTSLLQILQEGCVSVKFFTGKNISDIFGLFILKEHEAILEDIITSLPTVGDWTEGIASRLFVLAHLGSSWPTLLRRCIYAIFETAGQVQQSKLHAQSCLATMAKVLQLSNSRELFRLFASQIIFTWLESQELTAIPYSIFGYKALTNLLTDVQSEITGQIIMRGRDDEAEQLASSLSVSYKQLLEESFSKCAAYCIARDSAVPPAKDARASGGDVRLRKLIGRDQYSALISKHFPEIMATFFRIIEREDHIVKGFQGHEAYASAQLAYDEILSYGSSTAVLPASQQPSFKAGYLIDEIIYLYSRSGFDIEAAWSPPLYVYIFRSLLNTTHIALGSLHACSVLRKLRILICMAGETALKDYSVEMALHSLWPFLVDTHCAEDAIGICRYLITHSTPYLTDVPSFLAGFTVSTLASMRKFLRIPQDSTTQESQFRATMSRAQEFHTWLGTFAEEFSLTNSVDVDEIAFKAIVRSARQLGANGNARKGTYESDLLLELLKDRCSLSPLIEESFQDIIFDSLCSSFDIPANFRDDILGLDAQAADFANTIWDSCQHRSCGTEYLLWVARVLGRAYAGKGTIAIDMLREVQADVTSYTDPNMPQAMESGSRRTILRSLSDILRTKSLRDAGLAERTLQNIATKAESTDLWSDCEHSLPASLVIAMVWTSFACPGMEPTDHEILGNLEKVILVRSDVGYHDWARLVCFALVSLDTKDRFLSELKPILLAVDGLPAKLCPYILHLVLLGEIDKQQNARKAVSSAFGQCFINCTDATASHTKLMLHSILYLRTQPLPREHTKADRSQWLDLNYEQAANAAVHCGMFKTALLFLEIGFSENIKNSRSRRSSSVRPALPVDLLLMIFRNLDDKDSFYGIRQPSSLSAMMDQLEFENAGFKSLSFRGAHFDSQIRHSHTAERGSKQGIIKILDSLDLNGLSQSLLSRSGTTSAEAMLRTARKLERWDVSCPAGPTSTESTLFKVFQDIHNSTNYSSVTDALNQGFSATLGTLIHKSFAESSTRQALSCLAVLSEVEDIISSHGTDQLQETFANLETRMEWMHAQTLENTTTIIACRQTIFSTLSKSDQLRDLMEISQRDARRIECRALRAATSLSRHHGALQTALSTATYLGHIVLPCLEQGIKIDVAARLESSNVLWDQQEMSASIRVLRDITYEADLQSQDIFVGKPGLLAKLGHRTSEARLEKPEEIIKNYLLPAIKELQGVTSGHEAGQVFHEFASFCDQQLQNPDNLEDFERIQKLRERKEAEVEELETMIETAIAQSKEHDNLKSHLKKAQQWFRLDDREYQRLRESREAFLSQSLENYLLSLKACDEYDRDALRFSALWLEHSDDEIANAAVTKHITHVASRKFAPLMNQWTSRQLDKPTAFQTLLSAMIFRICLEHPYHGMYQVFASSKTKGGKDRAALSRNAAAAEIVSQFKNSRRAAPIWLGVHNSNIHFVRFATEKIEEGKYKPGARILLRKLPSGLKLEQDIQNFKIPPPTMKIPLRHDCNYSSVPTIVKFQSDFAVASGISMPKILTGIGSDGRKYKQLFKSGNDDLRQDAIMEQVFEQVSDLLKSHRNARQRNLGIRTYKVVPLTSTSGIMEFVSDTVPLHDYLMPAHQKHFPSDLKPNVCRKHILDVQSKSVEIRVKTFRGVCERFHPVLRYFFMELFDNPDDWFEKRLAYTRSTAVISILGYILGLGDRHGHNILLDEKTGEVVHIDLGIAFEQGRVLTVPEVVPFRLTRDLVDGMGVTGTEGGFRRCCEFTMEALRDESYSIMAVLDVLRYDPLYSWSLSPLRLKRLQENQEQVAAAENHAEDEVVGNEIQENEPGEADRALTVVAKKLSKSLSVTATVNELIQQATDEKNLALLFCGWAAYA